MIDFLSKPSLEVIDVLKNFKIIECGAGNGEWVKQLKKVGIDIIGIDPNFTGVVKCGTHKDLYKYLDRDLLLIVWPPDKTDLSIWINEWGKENVAICGDFNRFSCPDIEVLFYQTLVGGIKGDSSFILGKVQKF